MAGGDIHIRREGAAGRITLNRPQALNALTYAMALDMEAALLAWRDDSNVALVLIDAAGDKAFCAGGDIQQLYDTGRRGDYGFGQKFWRDEYRLNALIANYPKPYVAFCQGFVMGGGVGISCHGSHRIACETTRIAMPECGIGLIPDVGGSFLLAHAPGRCGEYLGLTGTRMDAGDAIFAGFADHFLPQERWEELKQRLIDSGDATEIAARAEPREPGALTTERQRIDDIFCLSDVTAMRDALQHDDTPWARSSAQAVARGCPLSLACALEIIRCNRHASRIEDALALEYRFSARCMQHGEFLEGIRAAVIDKDRTPKWAMPRLEDVSADKVAFMLASLGGDEWREGRE